MYKKINALKNTKFNLKTLYTSIVFTSTLLAILEVIQYKYMWKIFDYVKMLDDWEKIVSYISIFVAIVVGIVLFNMLDKYIKGKYLSYTIKTGYDNFINLYRMKDATTFKSLDAAYFSERVKNDLEMISNYYTDGILTFLLNILKLLLMVGISLFINIKITIGFILTVPILIFVYISFLKKMQDKAQSYQGGAAIYFSSWNGQLEYLKEIVQVGDYNKEKKDFKESFLTYFKKFFDFTKFNQIFNLSMTGVTIFTQILIIGLGSYFVSVGELSIGDLLVIVAYGQEVQKISMSLFQFGGRKAAMEASKEKLNELYDVKIYKEGTIEIDTINKIEGNISFAFDDKKIYDDFNIKLSKGKLYGIIGDNGKGKTTLIRILTGVYKENENSIINLKVNDIDIKNIDTVKLRRNNISFVSQFPTTIYDKISEYICGEHDINSESEFTNLLEEINLENIDEVNIFIKSIYKNNFKDLSGGDRTFICILGAVASNKDFIIMDEPTANLDKNRKKWLIKTLNSIKNQKIILVISHDEEMIKEFDEKIEI